MLVRQLNPTLALGNLVEQQITAHTCVHITHLKKYDEIAKSLQMVTEINLQFHTAG